MLCTTWCLSAFVVFFVLLVFDMDSKLVQIQPIVLHKLANSLNDLEILLYHNCLNIHKFANANS